MADLKIILRCRTILGAVLCLVTSGTALGERPLPDYTFIRGVCYDGWAREPEKIHRELGYAKRLNFNSTRIWLDNARLRLDPDEFVTKLRTYVRAAQEMGISTMPILFNGNGLNPQTLKPESWPAQEAYVSRVIAALKDEPGLLMWDVMNEPSFNDYYWYAPEAAKPEREKEIRAYLDHFTKYVRSKDPVNAITVGHTIPENLHWSPDVDVLSFHDYASTRKLMERNYTLAEAFAKKHGKPLINSELGCVCRANPYDVALEACERHKIGWYVFNLMIEGGWSDVHGIVYPDGTVRDPSIVAALYGWHRKRDLRTSIVENSNREDGARRALARLENALDRPTREGGEIDPTDTILEAAEFCANLLEAAQLVPMREPPSAKILRWRSQARGERDIKAIRGFALEIRDKVRVVTGQR